MSYRLYRSEFCWDDGKENEVEFFSPSPLRGLFLYGEVPAIRTALARSYFWAISKGKLKIFYFKSENGEILHTSYVIPKCNKFPFMGNEDYEIGPCNTIESARGRGLYPRMLKYITRCIQYEGAHFWMLVNENNAASIKGVEKAGFALVGYAEKTKYLKRYLRVEEA